MISEKIPALAHASFLTLFANALASLSFIAPERGNENVWRTTNSKKVLQSALGRARELRCAKFEDTAWQRDPFLATLRLCSDAATDALVSSFYSTVLLSFLSSPSGVLLL